MHSDALKLSESEAAEIRAHLKSFASDIKKLNKAKDQNGTFDVIISTEVKDRAGEIVRQDGWDLANYKNNPIVLWGHDYWGVPIGICTEVYATEYRGVKALGAKGIFYPAEINPLAQQVRKAYEFGLAHGVSAGCTTSVGFIPKEFDPEDRSIITNSELLEFSFVPIPANQGVGAAGRALTEAEAKEIGLDVPGLVRKGMSFLKTVDVEPEAEDAEAVEDDTAEATDADETTEVEPEAKAAEVKDPREPQKALLKAIAEEHDRHTGEIEDAFEDFRTKAPAVVEDQPDQNDDQEPMDTNGSTKPDAMREAVKELRSAISDEHTAHKAAVVKCFKSFEPTDEKKAFDRNKHLKAVRAELSEYEGITNKAMDEFEERCMKSMKTVQGEPGEIDDHTDWITGILDAHGKAHKRSIVNIAKKMAREARGDDETADEKTIELVKTHIAPFVDPKNLTAVSIRIAAQITSETRKSLGEAHSQLKAATAIVEALHGDLGNDEGDESRSVADDKSAESAPARQRSRPTEDVRDAELDAHLLAKDILRGITTLTQQGLETLNKRSKS